MGKDITYEAQLRNNGTWRTVTVFNDREDAVAEAERILAARRTPAVRVLQVVYDTQSQQYAEHTVFKATCVDEDNEKARDKSVAFQSVRRRGRRPQQHAATAERFPFALTALGIVSVVVLAASVLLHWSH